MADGLQPVIMGGGKTTMSGNLVLEIMRAIRGDLAEMRAKQRAEMGGRFDRILDRLE